MNYFKTDLGLDTPKMAKEVSYGFVLLSNVTLDFQMKCFPLFPLRVRRGSVIITCCFVDAMIASGNLHQIFTIIFLCFCSILLMVRWRLVFFVFVFPCSFYYSFFALYI